MTVRKAAMRLTSARSLMYSLKRKDMALSTVLVTLYQSQHP
jgi:hypothetical protein